MTPYQPPLFPLPAEPLPRPVPVWTLRNSRTGRFMGPRDDGKGHLDIAARVERDHAMRRRIGRNVEALFMSAENKGGVREV